MIFTTSVNMNYLPKARTLAQSVKKTYPDSKFVLCLVEREKLDITSFSEFDEVVTPKDVWPNDHEATLYKYDVVEACTAIKGELFCHLFEKHRDEIKFVYLDPDTFVFAPLKELEEALEKYQVVVTPHLTEPEVKLEAILDNEISVARHGVFNLGFLAVSRGETSAQFVRWWADRLKIFSYADYWNGLFTDQKWVDQAPAFFDIYILKHPGYNVAPWNISKRKITQRGDAYFVNETYQLRFFHFSGLDSGANIVMLNKYAGKDSEVFKIREGYLDQLRNNGESSENRGPWSYDILDSKSKFVKKSKRLLQRDVPIERPYIHQRIVPALLHSIKRRLKKSIQAFAQG